MGVGKIVRGERRNWEMKRMSNLVGGTGRIQL